MILGLIYSKNINLAVEDGKTIIAQAEVGVFFFAVGHSTRKCFEMIKKWVLRGRVLMFVVGCMLLIVTFVLSRFNTDILMFINDYGNSWLFIICSLMGIFGVFCIAIAVKHSKVLEFYGRNSLVILVTHFTVRTVIGNIISRITPDYVFIRLPIVVLIVVLIETFIAIFVGKYMRWFKCDFKQLRQSLFR